MSIDIILASLHNQSKILSAPPAHYCKPNLNYYKELLERLNLTPEECLMIGNDVDDDMIVEKLGMKVFLLTDCLINKSGADISVYPHGSYDALDSFINHIEDAE